MKKLTILSVLILTFCILIGCSKKEENFTASQYNKFAQIAEKLEKVKSPDFIETKRGLAIVYDIPGNEGVFVRYLEDNFKVSYPILPKDVIRIISQESHEEWRKAALQILGNY